MAPLLGDDDLAYIPFTCESKECKQCLNVREDFDESTFNLADCLKYCRLQNKSGFACVAGCKIMNDVISYGDNKSIPVDKSNHAVLNGVSLGCRNRDSIILQIDAGYTNYSAINEPHGFIVLFRKHVSGEWRTTFFDQLMMTFESIDSLQIAVAMVSIRGLVLKTINNSSLVEEILARRKMFFSFRKSYNMSYLQPVKNYTIKYTLNPKSDREATVDSVITWTPPSPSKPCDYKLDLFDSYTYQSKLYSFKEHNKYDHHYRLIFQHTFKNLKVDEPYVLKIFSEGTQGHEREIRIKMRTPSVLSFINKTHENTHKNQSLPVHTSPPLSLPGPLRNVSVTSLIYLGNGTSLATVTWQPPIVTSLHLSITGYKICWRSAAVQKNILPHELKRYSDVLYLNPNNTTCEFEVNTGLVYNLRVSANSTFGEGKVTLLSFTAPFPPTNKSNTSIITPYVVTKYNKDSSHLIAIGVLLALVLPSLAVGRYLYKKRRQREAKAMRIQLREEFLEEGLILPIGEADEWEVSYDLIVLGEEIGSGAFGTVCKARVSSLPAYPDQSDLVVAVKTLKAMATIDDQKDFLAEIAMMKHIGKHLNVVSMLGCVTQGGPLCLITEYCRYGDLRSYLRLIRDKNKIHPHFKLGPAYEMHRHNFTPTKKSFGEPENLNKLFSTAYAREGFHPTSSTLHNSSRTQTGGMHRLRNCFCIGNCSCSKLRSLSTNGGEYCNERVLGSSESFLSENSTNPFRNPLDNTPPASLAQPLTPTKLNMQASSAYNFPTSQKMEHQSTEGSNQIDCSAPYISPLPVFRQSSNEQLVDIVAGEDEMLVKFTNYQDCRSNGNVPTVETEDDTTGSPTLDRKELTQNELMSFARQIAVGMEYLSQKKFVHRDLAARNILVCDNNLVKVSDFGLTRDVYTSVEYHKSSNSTKLPLKWMAPESLFENINTSKSDVWSYGILLWEIVTLGGSPYPGISGKDLCKMLKDGYRMEKPDMCSQQIYEIMTSCWEFQREHRPTFTELRSELESLMEIEDEVYIDVNLDDNVYSLLVRHSSGDSSS